MHFKNQRLLAPHSLPSRCQAGPLAFLSCSGTSQTKAAVGHQGKGEPGLEGACEPDPAEPEELGQIRANVHLANMSPAGGTPCPRMCPEMWMGEAYTGKSTTSDKPRIVCTTSWLSRQASLNARRHPGNGSAQGKIRGAIPPPHRRSRGGRAAASRPLPGKILSLGRPPDARLS